MTSTAGPPVCNSAGTWQISRHRDLVQALRDRRLVPQGQAGTDPLAHQWLHAAVAQALSADRLQAWRQGFADQAHALLLALPTGVSKDAPIDLVQGLAEPWSQAVATQVCGVPAEQARDCERLAQLLYLAAAQADSGQPTAAATDAAAQLAGRLAGLPCRPGGVADVQAYVALSQTLPALLAGAWLALLRDEQALAHLLAAPHDTASFTDELLRLGSPAQVVFREATCDLEIGEAKLRRGDQVDLLLAAANRDAQQFPDPHRLVPGRTQPAQVGLGAGLHHCAGAALVRLALVVATQALLERCRQIALARPGAAELAWRGGHAMRAPAQLPVHWQARP